MRTVFSLIISILFPHSCCVCGALWQPLCWRCIETLDFCDPIATTIFYPAIKLQSVCRFTKNAQAIIHAYKYLGVQKLAEYIAFLMYYCLDFSSIEAITAVPLHPKRLAERGFNQTELIAQHLSKLLERPYVPLLVKSRHTSNQVKSTSKTTRSTQQKGSFSLAPHFAHSFTTVLLIDDVVTTGSTLTECCELLRKQGITPHCATFCARI